MYEQKEFFSHTKYRILLYRHLLIFTLQISCGYLEHHLHLIQLLKTMLRTYLHCCILSISFFPSLPCCSESSRPPCFLLQPGLCNTVCSDSVLRSSSSAHKQNGTDAEHLRKQPTALTQMWILITWWKTSKKSLTHFSLLGRVDYLISTAIKEMVCS